MNIPPITQEYLSVEMIQATSLSDLGPGGETFKRALSSWNAHKRDEALRLYEQALAQGLTPLAEGASRCNVAQIMLDRGQLSDALTQFVAVLKLPRATYDSVNDASQHLQLVLEESGRRSEAAALATLAAKAQARLGYSLRADAKEKILLLVRQQAKDIAPSTDASDGPTKRSVWRVLVVGLLMAGLVALAAGAGFRILLGPGWFRVGALAGGALMVLWVVANFQVILAGPQGGEANDGELSRSSTGSTVRQFPFRCHHCSKVLLNAVGFEVAEKARCPYCFQMNTVPLNGFEEVFSNLSPGAKVPRSGRYECEFCGRVGFAERSSRFFKAGDSFDECPNCRDAARWAQVAQV